MADASQMLHPQTDVAATDIVSSAGFGGSIFLSNLHHMFAQTDGSYRFPNSREGDMLKTAKREIEQLRTALSEYAKRASTTKETE